MAEEIKFREEQWETAIRRQTKQNAILRRAVQDQSLDETLTALAEFAQEQVTGTLATVALANRDATRIERCIGPNLPPAYINALIGLKIGPHALADGTAMHTDRKSTRLNSSH